ncbi:MAG: HD domain-containing protein [Gemmatimonadota bacterium]|nr:HD domain-containing protein [Gemmatimonadota bacterium]
MRTRQLWFAIIVSVVAIAAGSLLAWGAPPISDPALHAVIVLSLLAMIAEMLAFLLPHGAKGSIAFIPYLASALIAPHWASVAAIVTVASVIQISHKTRLEALIFNIAQQALTLTIAILVYQQLGGISFLALPHQDFGWVTRHMGLPAISAYAVSFAVNTIVVSMFIAVGDGESTLSVWRDVKLSTIGVDLLASPIVFAFAWLYSVYDAIAAAVIWVPMVGLRQVHRTNLELERTNQELLELMVKSIEARDPYTSGHSRRVQHYSTIIARSLGMRERDVALVGRAALLHDVGKIHEKYGQILSKADRLSADEWRIMQEHPVDGAELVATMSRLRDLVSAIRHHHENWDGTGYPDGLAGESIPMAARVIRFADTIDAMTTQRPYRAALSYDQVRQEIVRCRGTQFDPDIADRLLASAAWKTLFAPPSLPGRSQPGLSLVKGARAGVS